MLIFSEKTVILVGCTDQNERCPYSWMLYTERGLCNTNMVVFSTILIVMVVKIP